MFQFKTTVAIVAIASLPLSAAHAQSYYGAGSTLQPSRQYQQLQQEQARRAQQYYYVPAAPAQRQTDQSRYMAYPDRSLGAIGYPQVPVYLSPQAADRIAVIQHETIPGFMESMTMEFPIKDPAEFAKLAVGQRIRATVCQQSRGLDFWLQGIVVEK